MKILGWTMNGENINQEIPAIYGESSSSPFFETEASYDMNIGFNVVDTTYKVYVAYGEHVIHDEENTVEINDVPYNVYTGCEGSGNIVKLRPQPKTGYKIYSVSDMHSGYEYENVYEVDVYPHIDENGKYDYSSPVFIYVTAKPGDFVVYTSTYEHANGISGGTAVILENESTSYTTGYNSVVTVKATPNKQTSLYRYEFDRWVLEGKDLWGQKYYVEIEQTDSINPHNSQMQFLVTEEQTRLCACFKIYYRNNIQYEYQVPVINMGLKPSIIPQSESTTSINVKFTVNSEDITAADLRCKAGVLVSAIPHMTIERHKTILNTVNTRSTYSHNFTFDEEITNDFIKENIEIPIEFDGLKPSKVYIFRPYVFDGNYYVYGDDTYIYTDIDPLGNTETPYTLNGLFLINEPGEDLPKSLELLNQNTESIENARKALQIYPQLGELVKSTDSVSNVIGVPQFIRFTTGNLQCEIDEEHFFRFKFAEHQYDIVGSDNMDTIDNHSGVLDTFGWGTSGHYFYGESGFTYDPQTGYPIETTNSTGTPIAQGKANEFDYLRCISMNTMPWSSYSGTLSELTQTDIDAYNSDIDAYNSWLEDYSGFDEDKINKLKRKYISKAAITSAWFYSLHDNLSHGYGPGEKYKNLKSMDDGYHPCQVSYNSDIARKYFDWGQNEIEGMAPGTYHMLYYPKYFRENHGKLKVRLNNVDGVMYKPDNWKEKYNDTGLFDFLSTNYVNGRIHLSPQEFRILEQYGFVFFPEAGVRYENNWIQEDGRLFYWAGNASGWDSVNFANDMFGDTKPISFDGYTYTAADRRFLGKAVRLVCDEVWTDRGKFERPTMTFDSSWFVIKNESVKYELHTYETFGINGNHEVRKYSQSDNCVEIEPDSSVICTTSGEESKSERIVCGNKYISDGQKVVFDISVTEPQYKIKIIRVSQEGDTKNPMSMHCPTNNLIYDSVNEVFYAYEDDEVMHSEVEFKTNGKNIILSVFLERKQ